MAEGNVHPGSFVGDSIEEFKKLPTWGKVAVVAGIMAVAYIAIRMRTQGLTAQQAAGITAGSPDTTGSMAGSSSPFPMVGNTPLLPTGINPVYDGGGNLVAYQQQPTPSPTQPGASSGPMPGSTFTGSTGVFHYDAAGGQTLSQIASMFGLGSWNSIYAIPDNQKAFGKLNATQAANYVPKAGQTVVLPSSTNRTTYASMSNPNVYLQSATPHLPSTVPQSGRLPQQPT